MTMRGVLVHVDEHQALESVLTCALLVGRRFDSQLDGLHARPGAPRIIPVAPEGAFIPASEIVEDLERADRDLDRQLRERFETFMRERGVAEADLGARTAVTTVVALAYLGLRSWVEADGAEPLVAVVARCLLLAPDPARFAVGVTAARPAVEPNVG